MSETDRPTLAPEQLAELMNAIERAMALEGVRMDVRNRVMNRLYYGHPHGRATKFYAVDAEARFAEDYLRDARVGATWALGSRANDLVRHILALSGAKDGACVPRWTLEFERVPDEKRRPGYPWRMRAVAELQEAPDDVTRMFLRMTEQTELAPTPDPEIVARMLRFGQQDVNETEV